MLNRIVKKTILWSLFIFFDLLIAIGLGEAWVRCFIPVKNICYQVDPKIGVTYCPNQNSIGHTEDGYSNVAITNRYGFHDIERKIENTDGRYRIQIYGDSMIAGMGVKIEETIPWLLERELNKRDNQNRIEVLNMAAGTDSTNGQVMTFMEIGERYDVDMIICHFIDDFGDNVLEISGVKTAPYFEKDEKGELFYIPPEIRETNSFVKNVKRKWSLLYRHLANKIIESTAYYKLTILKRKIKLFVHNLGGSDRSPSNTDYDRMIKDIYINKAWPISLELIKYFNSLAASKGARFILSDGRVFDHNIGTVFNNSDLEDFCRQNGIDYIQSYKVYERLQHFKEDFFFVDGHPNVAGNNAISKGIAAQIRGYLYDDGVLE